MAGDGASARLDAAAVNAAGLARLERLAWLLLLLAVGAAAPEMVDALSIGRGRAGEAATAGRTGVARLRAIACATAVTGDTAAAWAVGGAAAAVSLPVTGGQSALSVALDRDNPKSSSMAG